MLISMALHTMFFMSPCNEMTTFVHDNLIVINVTDADSQGPTESQAEALLHLQKLPLGHGMTMAQDFMMDTSGLDNWPLSGLVSQHGHGGDALLGGSLDDDWPAMAEMDLLLNPHDGGIGEFPLHTTSKDQLLLTNTDVHVPQHGTDAITSKGGPHADQC
jgi:hypothetical protein